MAESGPCRYSTRYCGRAGYNFLEMEQRRVSKFPAVAANSREPFGLKKLIPGTHGVGLEFRFALKSGARLVTVFRFVADFNAPWSDRGSRGLPPPTFCLFGLPRSRRRWQNIGNGTSRRARIGCIASETFSFPVFNALLRLAG